jgi:two-component system response regulator GlrR
MSHSQTLGRDRGHLGQGGVAPLQRKLRCYDDDDVVAREETTNRDASTEVVRRGDASLVQRFSLTIVAGHGAGRVTRSSGERFAIGFDESNDLVLGDRSVSRFHCEITISGGAAVVNDLGSANGTIVDGVSVFHARLRSGQTLTLGRVQVRFDLDTDAVQIPLSKKDRFGLMVGSSRAMRAAFALLEKAAPADTTVLLEGETGTGKEAAAESIHRESRRKKGPFVVVDCGAIPTNLLESELFGHEKGSFTGAVAMRQGAFEAADGGTVFLDEIGELATELQPKLLRVLERREIKRVGSPRFFPVNVRLIAATNRDLRAEVNERRFRSDLFYRLAVVQIRLPALRERPEDLAGLIGHILGDLGLRDHPEAERLESPELLDDLKRHAWPGNVRELRNYIERSLTLEDMGPPAHDSAASGAAGFPGVLSSLPLKEARDQLVRDFERRYLADLLANHGGKLTEAARLAGIDRITLYRLLRRHGLR